MFHVSITVESFYRNRTAVKGLSNNNQVILGDGLLFFFKIIIVHFLLTYF